MGTFFPDTVSSLFRRSLTHTHARTRMHTRLCCNWSTNIPFSNYSLPFHPALSIFLCSSLQSKHIQFVSGVHASVYWTANWAWDVINFLVPLIVILIIFAAFNIDAFKGDTLGIVFLILVRSGRVSNERSNGEGKGERKMGLRR